MGRRDNSTDAVIAPPPISAGAIARSRWFRRPALLFGKVLKPTQTTSIDPAVVDCIDDLVVLRLRREAKRRRDGARSRCRGIGVATRRAAGQGSSRSSRRESGVIVHPNSLENSRHQVRSIYAVLVARGGVVQAVIAHLVEAGGEDVLEEAPAHARTRFLCDGGRLLGPFPHGVM
jgi:hypothetical protein